jgi:hypothetical protein
MSARVSSTLFVFFVKLVYILFWTWILNLICGSGHPGVAWFLVLIPFILLIAVVLIFMVNPYVLEGLTKKDEVRNSMAPLNRALGAS